MRLISKDQAFSLTQLNYTYFLVYSHSNAPLCHSYTKPMVKIIKKKIILQKENNAVLDKTRVQGNKKLISKSNIKNKIATK